MLHSKMTGGRIPKAIYVSVALGMIFVPLILGITACEFAYWLLVLALFGGVGVMTWTAENRLLFEFRQGEYIVLNAFGLKKRAVPIGDIAAIVVVGAVWTAGGPIYSRPLGHRVNGEFMQEAFALLYTDCAAVKYAYDGAAGGFILYRANLAVFEELLRATKCPIYIDETVCGALNLPENRVRKLEKGQ